MEGHKIKTFLVELSADLKVKMKILKFCWYCLCALFCLYSLYTLVRDSREVIYEKSNQTEPFSYLVCEKLRNLYPNKTEIDLVGLREELYRHLNSTMGRHGRRTKFPRLFEDLVLNRTRSGGYLILDERICLIVNEDELYEIDLFLSLFPIYYFAIKSDTLDFVLMKSPKDKIDQLVVLKKGYPYSDCDESNSQFFCLNDCHKRRTRLARYFYHSNEIGHI